MTQNFEEEYEGVLQNLEFAIVNVAREIPDLVDFDVETALENLIRHYSAEAQNRTVTLRPLNAERQAIFDRVQAMCEWRLGRSELTAEEDLSIPMPEALSVDEIVACLKRIRKSVQRWTKQGGRQGYLTFVGQFIA